MKKYQPKSVANNRRGESGAQPAEPGAEKDRKIKQSPRTRVQNRPYRQLHGECH
jgi:hypothetical protein